MLPRFPYRILVTGFVWLLAKGIQAQCGTIQTVTNYTPPAMGENRGSGPWIIPVLVHVYYSDNLQPVSPSYITDAIDECNLHMRAQGPDLGDVHPAFVNLIADCNVELRLAKRDEDGNCISGIIYHDFGSTFPTSLINSYSQNVNNYLNIHVLPSQNSWTILPFGSSAGTLDDLIVFSTYDVVFRPQVLAHELGHWLGLYHTFGSANESGLTCGDDGVEDTPLTKGSVVGTCNQQLSECTTGIIENVDNHMDYSNCGKMFTLGQAQIMAGVLSDPEIPRYNHTQEANLTLTGVFEEHECNMQTGSWSRNFSGCDSTRVELFAWAEGQIPDYTEWTFPGGSPSVSYAQHTQTWYTEEGNYTARL